MGKLFFRLNVGLPVIQKARLHRTQRRNLTEDNA